MILRLLLLSGFVFGARAEDKTWQAKMNELSIVIGETIPLLYPDPNKDVSALKEKINKIYVISSGLDVMSDHMLKSKDYDPALPYLASMFKEDIERAKLSMEDGHVDYAKSVIRASTAYCIACHTRTKGGAEFPLISAYNQPLKSASWITKIEFLTASRQFDAVLTQVMGTLEDPGKLGISALDLERASRLALAIAVRVKKDPVKAKLLAAAVIKSPTASFSLKEGAKTWARDITDWQKEKPKKYASDADLLKAGKELVDQALNSPDPMGGHDEVRYLRASMLMHELLKQYPESKLKGEAMFLIGMSYNAIQDLGVWSLHDKYFRACIDEQPHSKLAERCYKQYEQSTVLGYSGSSGIHVPRQVQRHLEKLKQKAKVQ
jgi:mono/diheme cytochrome c family protein